MVKGDNDAKNYLLFCAACVNKSDFRVGRRRCGADLARDKKWNLGSLFLLLLLPPCVIHPHAADRGAGSAGCEEEIKTKRSNHADVCGEHQCG